MATERNPYQNRKPQKDLQSEEALQRKSVVLSSHVDDHLHSMLYEVGCGTVKHESDKELTVTVVPRADTALASP